MAQFFTTNNNALLLLPSFELTAPIVQSISAPTFSSNGATASYSITFTAPSFYRNDVTHYRVEEARVFGVGSISADPNPFERPESVNWQQIAVIATADLPIDNRVNIIYTATNRAAVSFNNALLPDGFGAGRLYQNNVYYYRVRAVTLTGTTPYSNIIAKHLVYAGDVPPPEQLSFLTAAQTVTAWEGRPRRTFHFSVADSIPAGYTFLGVQIRPVNTDEWFFLSSYELSRSDTVAEVSIGAPQPLGVLSYTTMLLTFGRIENDGGILKWRRMEPVYEFDQYEVRVAAYQTGQPVLATLSTGTPIIAPPPYNINKDTQIYACIPPSTP